VTFDNPFERGARRGLLHAIEDGRATLRAASLRPIADVRNGWFFPLALGRYGDDHLMRAAVAFRWLREFAGRDRLRRIDRGCAGRIVAR
jgi:hypothetical protein